MAVTLDLMEYASDELAQAAYPSSDVDAVEESFETGGDSIGALGDQGGTDYTLAWQFTTDRTILLSAASIYIEGKNGDPTGDITFRIETNVGNLPSGTLVHADATGSIPNASVNIAGWNKCSFTPSSLAAGTYWLVIIIDAQANNVYWKWTRDGNGAGRTAYSTNFGASWTGVDNLNMPYSRVYTLHLQCYSEDTIIQQGIYSLKGIAKATDALNATLTRTVDPTIDLSGQPRMYLYIRASRTGSNIKVGIHDSGGVTTEVTPNIASANTWQAVEVDISAVADADKDAIDSIVITIVNADADNIFYLDDMYGGLIIVSRERNIVYDSILELSKTRDIVYDSVLELSKTRDIVYDSVLELSRERNIVYDSILELSRERNIVYDAILWLSRERNILYDSVLELSRTRNIRYDSVLEVSKERNILYDLFELIQRLEAPTGVWIKQDRPSDGAIKQDRPTGTWVKQDKPS